MEFTTRLELQSQTTRLVEGVMEASHIGINGAVTLLGAPFKETWPTCVAITISPDHNSEDFQSELFPLHSPLLRESLLESFLPPSYIWYSWLIGGLNGCQSTTFCIQRKIKHVHKHQYSRRRISLPSPSQTRSGEKKGSQEVYTWAFLGRTL